MVNKGLMLLGGALLFIGCGGSGTTSIETGTGTYVDSPIDGVSYVCGRKSGTTGDTGVAGGFTFEKGAGCVFSINTIELRKVVAGDLSDGVKVVEDELSKARFLLSLDKDGDSENGIEITAEIAKALADLNIEFPQDDVAVASMVTSLKGKLGAAAYDGKARTLEYAQVHLAGLSVTVTADKTSVVEDQDITLTSTAIGIIESYVWKDGGVEIADANESTLTKNDFSVGPHTVTVEVTNSNDVTAQGSVSFRVTENPIAPEMNVTVTIPTGYAAISHTDSITFRANVENPGAGLEYEWIDMFTSATATTPTLGNSGFNRDGSPAGDNHGVPVQYNDKETIIGTSEEITVTLSEGTHNIVLKVTDEDNRTSYSKPSGIWVNFNGIAPSGDYVLIDSIKNLTWVNDPSANFEACFAVYSLADLNSADTHCESLDTFNDGNGYANVHGWRTPTTAEIKDFITRTYVGNIRPETTSGNPCPYMLGFSDGNYSSVSTRHYTSIIPGTVYDVSFPAGLRCVRTGI